MVMKEISETELSRLRTQNLVADSFLAMEADKRIKTAEKGHKSEAKRQAKFFSDLLEKKLLAQLKEDLQDPKFRELCKQYGIDTRLKI
jgi:hypothetical protein